MHSQALTGDLDMHLLAGLQTGAGVQQIMCAKGNARALLPDGGAPEASHPAGAKVTNMSESNMDLDAQNTANGHEMAAPC